MTDPLSVAGSVVGILSLGIQATQSLVNFYQSYKHQDSNLAHITERLDSLLDIFQCLEKALSDRKQSDTQSLVQSIKKSIENCGGLIQELQDECEKFSKTTSQGIKAAARAVGYRVTYPFRQSTLQKLDEDIGEILANLSPALNVLQLEDNKRTEDLLDLIRTTQIASNLRDWLNAPDATIDHNAACEKKYHDTGMWLVKSPQFSTWLTEENSSMWLNGFAGSGKSVLCSTAIQFAWRQRRDSGIGIAFFYFTFNDKSKQDESAMLRALLLQLSIQLQDGHADLSRLHDLHKVGVPRSQVLLDHLHRLIQRFRHVYILLDALDESPRNGLREGVLDALEVMQRWGVKGLHLFVTSRDESDIRETLSLSQPVTMQNVEMNKDIVDFISGHLDTNRRLRKWLPYREKIEETLAKRAEGV